MRRAITAAALAAGLLLTGCSSYTVEDCKNALTDKSTKTSRPKECEDLSQKDYDLLLMGRALEKGLSEMDQEDRDVLDMYDDGKVNGSINPE